MDIPNLKNGQPEQMGSLTFSSKKKGGIQSLNHKSGPGSARGTKPGPKRDGEKDAMCRDKSPPRNQIINEIVRSCTFKKVLHKKY